MSHSLQWVRLDTALPDHPKMFDLYATGDYRACLLYVWGLTYAGRHNTGGFIPRDVIAKRLEGRPRDAKRLVDVSLWTECAGGYDINGWDEYQVMDDEAVKRREKAKAAAAARWSKSQARR